MNWYKKAKDYTIHPYSWETWGEEDDSLPDVSDVAQGAERAFQDSGISPKGEYSHVALIGNEVAGAISSNWDSQEGPNGEEVMVYSFDVAVHPGFRSGRFTGIDLIKRAIEEYENEKNALGGDYQTMMRLWVVNNRLAKFLEDRMDFEVESTYGDYESRDGDGGTFLVRY